MLIDFTIIAAIGFVSKIYPSFLPEKTQGGLFVSLMNLLPLVMYKIKICWTFYIQIMQSSSIAK